MSGRDPAQAKRRPQRDLTAVAFALLVLAWGSSFLLMKISLAGLTPPQIALGRALLGAVTLSAVAWIGSRSMPTEPRLWAHMAVIALTQCVIPYQLTAWVVQFVPSSLASIYNAIVPTMTLVFTPLLLRGERLTRLQVIGIAVGVGGVVVLVGPWEYLDAAALSTSAPAQLGMLVSASVYAFGLVYMRRFLRGATHDAMTISTMQIILAAAMLVLLAPFTALSPVAMSAPVVVSMLLLGAIGTGVAYVWQTRIVRAWGATRASTVTYGMPVVGVVLGIAVLGETVRWNEPVGGAIVLGGVLAAQLGTSPGGRA